MLPQQIIKKDSIKKSTLGCGCLMNIFALPMIIIVFFYIINSFINHANDNPICIDSCGSGLAPYIAILWGIIILSITACVLKLCLDKEDLLSVKYIKFRKKCLILSVILMILGIIYILYDSVYIKDERVYKNFGQLDYSVEALYSQTNNIPKEFNTNNTYYTDNHNGLTYTKISDNSYMICANFHVFSLSFSAGNYCKTKELKSIVNNEFTGCTSSEILPKINYGQKNVYDNLTDSLDTNYYLINEVCINNNILQLKLTKDGLDTLHPENNTLRIITANGNTFLSTNRLVSGMRVQLSGYYLTIHNKTTYSYLAEEATPQEFLF